MTVGTTYYPGYSAEMQDNSWVPPLWLGSVHSSELSKSDVRAAYAVLNDLTRAGVLQSRTTSRGRYFNLTLRGIPYYYDRNDVGDNPDHLAYMCYSTIVPRQVMWNQPIPAAPRTGKAEAFETGFAWAASAPAPWVDAFLRAHSVILAPVGSPAVVKFGWRDGAWQVEAVSGLPPRVAAPAAWKDPPITSST